MKFAFTVNKPLRSFSRPFCKSGVSVPKIHELHDLLTILLPRDATLQVVRRGLRGLSRFAVDYRYPGFHANARKAQASLRRAERIRFEVRRRLGLRAKA
jgi:hypothetical protein